MAFSFVQYYTFSFSLGDVNSDNTHVGKPETEWIEQTRHSYRTTLPTILKGHFASSVAQILPYICTCEVAFCTTLLTQFHKPDPFHSSYRTRLVLRNGKELAWSWENMFDVAFWDFFGWYTYGIITLKGADFYFLFGWLFSISLADSGSIWVIKWTTLSNNNLVWVSTSPWILFIVCINLTGVMFHEKLLLLQKCCS